MTDTAAATPPTLRIVDLFAGIGGLRLGASQAVEKAGYTPEVVFTSEIKASAVAILEANHPDEPITGDIRDVDPKHVPDHDLLLAGFPCQTFSHAGLRRGFLDDTRGTLFFTVASILKEKRPQRFVLENVEGLLTHDPDPENLDSPFGRTFSTILTTLRELGYVVEWTVEDATQHGVPQARRRVFILGNLDDAPDMSKIVRTVSEPLASILEENPEPEEEPKLDEMNELLRETFGTDLTVLEGRIFRDWRGGARNIHSWDFGFKGDVTVREQRLMERIMRESKRKTFWFPGERKVGEGVFLTQAQIETFSGTRGDRLRTMLDRLTGLGYLQRDGDTWKLSSGKLTMPVSHVLPRDVYANTLVATDADRLTVAQGDRLRRFTDVELRRLFGFPDDFNLAGLSRRKLFDLFGNSVVVPVTRSVVAALF